MSPIKMLEDALAEGRSFADLAGKLRDKFKSGTADLKAIYDEAESVVDGAIAKAKDGLAAFKAEVSKVEDDVKEAEAGTPGVDKGEPAKSGAAIPDASKPAPVTSTSPTGAAITVDADKGTTTHVDGAGFTTTLDHATGSATATDANGAPVEPHPAAVDEASIAATIAGVTVQHAG